MVADDEGAAPQSQTLDRGIRILEHLAAVGTPQPIVEIGSALGLHRSITYRLLRTLEDHQLVERDAVGHYWLGLGVAGLARGVRTDLQTAALPRLTALVAELGMTAFLVVRAGDEAVTVASVEPQDTAAHVVYRPGTLQHHPAPRWRSGTGRTPPPPGSPANTRTDRAASTRPPWARKGCTSAPAWTPSPPGSA